MNAGNNTYQTYVLMKIVTKIVCKICKLCPLTGLTYSAVQFHLYVSPIHYAAVVVYIVYIWYMVSVLTLASLLYEKLTAIYVKSFIQT